MSSNEKFFEEPREHSKIKSDIIVEYFDAWANIIISQLEQRSEMEPRACYLELFSGPGYYEDGTESTPLRVVRKVIDTTKFSPHIEFIFNDAAHEKAQRLDRALAGLPGIERLRYNPRVSTHEIVDGIPEPLLARLDVPCLAFVDPWGYKGLTSDLIVGLVKNWGCDCLFFFNYNRINAAISNPKVDGHMQSLFGGEQLAELRVKTDGAPPHVRTEIIMGTLKASLQGRIQRKLYIQEFHFVDDQADRTSHYIVGVTKNFTAVKIMKGVMAKHSSVHEQGVANFSRSRDAPVQQTLFPSSPIDDLKTELLRRYAGRTLTFRALLREHLVGTRYEEKHYKEVLGQLAADGRVSLSGLSSRGTIVANTLIIFEGCPGRRRPRGDHGGRP